jgi:hypothetical protein
MVGLGFAAGSAGVGDSGDEGLGTWDKGTGDEGLGTGARTLINKTTATLCVSSLLRRSPATLDEGGRSGC